MRKIICLTVVLTSLICVSCATFEVGNLNPKKRRAEYISQHPNSRFRVSIESGNLVIGMTQVEVVASIGSGWKINRTTGSYGVHEQWVLPHNSVRDSRYAYLYFENGILVSWQSR